MPDPSTLPAVREPTEPATTAGGAARPRPAVPPALDRAAAWGWRLVVVAVAAAVVLYALVELRVVVLPVVFALFLTALLVPPTDRLRARGWPSLAATWTVVLAAVVVLAGIVVLLARLVTPELDTLGEQAASGVREIEAWLTDGPLGLSQAQISSLIERAREEVQSNSSRLTRGVVSGATLAVELVTGLLLTLVLTFFFVKDGHRFGPWTARFFGDRVGRDLRAMGQVAGSTIGSYLRGVAIVGLVDGALIGVALVILRVPLAIPLAFLTWVGAFFPLVGAVLAGTLAALVALVTKGFPTALIVVAVTVAVQQIEGHVLAPVVLGRAVKLHPVVILLALAAGAVLAGIVGAFLAVPVVAVGAALGAYWRARAGPGAEASPERAEDEAEDAISEDRP